MGSLEVEGHGASASKASCEAGAPRLQPQLAPEDSIGHADETSSSIASVSTERARGRGFFEALHECDYGDGANNGGTLSVEPGVIAIGISANITALDDKPLDTGFENGWEPESAIVVPRGDDTIAASARLLRKTIDRHKAIDADEEWGDVELFLPERALPRAEADGEDVRLRELLLRALREGSVPERALIETCREADGSRDEEVERLLALVVGDLGADIDERVGSELDFDPGESTLEEEWLLTEAIEFADELGSGRNDPLRLYLKGLKGDLLDAEEEIALSRQMEQAGHEALEALSRWSLGLAAVFEAADRVARGEVDAEAYSSGPEPSEDEEAGLTVMSVDDDDEGIELDPSASAFIAAVAEARRAAGDHDRIRSALAAAGLSRGFLLDLAKMEERGVSGGAFASAVRRQTLARERMILANLRLAFSVAKRYRWSALAFDDLIQEGNIGLMKAVERYDWRKGFRFSTYATWWIREQITRAIADKSRVVRLPVHMHELAQRVLREREALEAQTGRAENERETAARTGLSLGKTRLLLSAFEETVSLDVPDEEKGLPGVEALAGPQSLDPAAAAEEAALGEILLGILDELDERSAKVIALRFGLDGNDAMTLEQVGRCFDVTRERIRQIESKALKRLSHVMRRKVLAPFMGDFYISPDASEIDEQTPTETDPAGTYSTRLTPADRLAKSTSPRASARVSQHLSRRQATTRASDSAEERCKISALVDKALSLGLRVDDGRSEGGGITITIPNTPDAEAHALGRAMISLGFRRLFGRTYFRYGDRYEK